MCFSNMEGGMEISLNKIKEDDIIKILFAEMCIRDSCDSADSAAASSGLSKSTI